jgi:hypothetical protein
MQVGSHEGADIVTFYPHICLYVGDKVSQGERQRLIAYRCTGADRARAMLECVRYAEKLMPVPKKDSLAEYRERYRSGYNIESIMSSHRREENITDMAEDEEFNFQCDEGMDSGDVDLMTRKEQLKS